MPRYLSHILAFGAGALCCWALQTFYRKGVAEISNESPPALELGVSEGETYRVRRVVDGDTIALENGLHVRFAGVNTPERGRYVIDPAPLAEQAKQRSAALMEGKRVRLRFARDPMDAHGRVVAHVYAVGESDQDEVNLEEALLREGLACALGLGLSSEEYGRLKELQTTAKEEGVGIWGLPHPLRGGNPRGLTHCASAKSGVFHRVDCSHAKRIPAANFKGYASLVEALASGRKACGQCGENGTR